MNSKVFRGEIDDVERIRFADQAVKKIIWDCEWYTQSDREVSWEVLQRSAYRISKERFDEIFDRACEEQNGYYGDWKDKNDPDDERWLQ